MIFMLGCLLDAKVEYMFAKLLKLMLNLLNEDAHFMLMLSFMLHLIDITLLC